MTRFCTLVSGSSGNAVFLSHNGTNILIDCGISGKKIAACLENIGVHASELDYILVTHEHIDHIQGVGVLSRRFDIPIVASCGTWRGMTIGDIADKNIKMFSENKQMDIGGIGVTPFDIPHDANQPTSYRFDVGNKCFAVATDIGHINDDLKKCVSGCEMAVLEANYDEQMLKNGAYPYPLKKRISGTHGHLCNDDAGALAVHMVENGTKHIMLGHLSKENNIPNLAFTTVARILEINGICVGTDVSMQVAPRYDVSPMIGA